MATKRKIYGTAISLRTIVQAAYNSSDWRTIYLTALPQGQFDYIANLPSGSNEALRQEIKKQFGIVGRFTTIETNVLFLKVRSTNAPGLKSSPARNRPSGTTGTTVASPAAGTGPQAGLCPQRELRCWLGRTRLFPKHRGLCRIHHLPHKLTNTIETCPVSYLADFLEGQVKIPVIDQTQLTNRFNIQLDWDSRNDPQHEKLKQALIDQLGLELVPGTAPVEMLVVEKVK